MKKENLGMVSIKYIAIDLIGNFFYWPAWWYTIGFFELVKRIYTGIIEEEKRFGIRIWFQNLFKPMYGQYDWQGRLISFFMRLVMLVFKLLTFLIWLILVHLVIIFWLVLPIIAIYMVIINFMYFFE